MKPLLPLAMLLAVGTAGCGKPDPYAKYRDVQLKRGMKIADIKQQFGEPDRFDDWWTEDPRNGTRRRPVDWDSQQSPKYPYHVQVLNYGAFGAHSQTLGHITKHRLSMNFLDGELYSWEKSTPVDRD